MSNYVQTKKILILAANPQGMDKLRLDKEARDIKEGLRQAREREQFIIESEWAVRPKDIRRAILYSKPQIVHFSGHGAENGSLAFEDEVGQVKLVHPEALADLFRLFSDHVQCVILNACYSEIQANAIAQHIDFVIGMNKAIGDLAAIEFAVGFYDALGADCPVEVAYEFGCNAIQMAGIQEHLTPVLRRKEASLPTESSSTARVSDSLTRSVNIKPTKVIYEFVLTGNVDEVSKQKLEAIFAHLQKITGDTSLTLLRIESSSIKLVLEGSEEGFRLLESLVASGELNEVLEIPVQKVSRRELRTSHSASFSSPKLVKHTVSSKQNITKKKHQRSLASKINDCRNHLGNSKTYIRQLGQISKRVHSIPTQYSQESLVDELFEISIKSSRTLRKCLKIEGILLDVIDNEHQFHSPSRLNYDSIKLRELEWLRTVDQSVAESFEFYKATTEQEYRSTKEENIIQDLLDRISYFQAKINEIRHCYHEIDCEEIIPAVQKIVIGVGLVCEGILNFYEKHSSFDSSINLGAMMFIDGTNSLIEKFN